MTIEQFADAVSEGVGMPLTLQILYSNRRAEAIRVFSRNVMNHLVDIKIQNQHNEDLEILNAITQVNNVLLTRKMNEPKNDSLIMLMIRDYKIKVK